VEYRPVFNPGVEQRIAGFEAGVANAIHHYIGILCRNATTLSQPAHALAPHMQMFDFDFTFQDMEYRVMLFFKYGADEQTIHIEDIDVMTI
jgi:hypothetical protein